MRQSSDSGPKILRVWYCAPSSKVKSIVQNGFFGSDEVINGWLGNGIYFALSPLYVAFIDVSTYLTLYCLFILFI